MAYTQAPETTYDHTNSIREDVLDEVAIMSPVTAPLVYHLGYGRPLGQPDYDWLMDYIEDPVTDLSNTGSSAFGGEVARRSAYPEGWEAQFPAPQTRQRAASTTCIVERTVDVSATQRVTQQYGVGDEYQYKIDQKFLEVVEQLDWNLHFGVYTDGGGGQSPADAARMTHGVIPWIFYTGYPNSFGAGSNPGGTVSIGGRTITRSPATNRTGFSGTYWSNDTNAALTRSDFHKNLLEPAYKRGMQIDGSVAFMGAAQKRIVSDFAYVYNAGTPQFGLNERNVQARERYINEGIDVFDTNLGTVIFTLDRQLDKGSAADQALSTGNSGEDDTIDVDDCFFILDLNFWNIRVLRGIGYTPLAKVGDADKALIVVEAGLEATNPIGGIAMNQVSGA